MMRAQSSHPLDPLSAAEISVAVATVRAAGATPEVRDSIRFIEVVLLEPDCRTHRSARCHSRWPSQGKSCFVSSCSRCTTPHVNLNYGVATTGMNQASAAANGGAPPSRKKEGKERASNRST